MEKNTAVLPKKKKKKKKKTIIFNKFLKGKLVFSNKKYVTLSKKRDLKSTKLIFMLAVHSHRGNPRQGESENVDGNTRLALDPLL